MELRVAEPDAASPGEWRVYLVDHDQNAQIPLGAGPTKTKALAAAGRAFAAIASDLMKLRVRARNLTTAPPVTATSVKAMLDQARQQGTPPAPPAPEAE